MKINIVLLRAFLNITGNFYGYVSFNFTQFSVKKKRIINYTNEFKERISRSFKFNLGIKSKIISFPYIH